MSGVSDLQSLEATVQALRQFAGADSMKLMLSLLSQLEQQYLRDLVDVTPEALAVKQGAVRQVIALRQSLTADHGGIPTI